MGRERGMQEKNLSGNNEQMLCLRLLEIGLSLRLMLMHDMFPFVREGFSAWSVRWNLPTLFHAAAAAKKQ